MSAQSLSGPQSPQNDGLVLPAGLGTFTVPERIPWSILGPEFLGEWGRFDPTHPQPEHVEVLGPNGSGKTYAIGTLIGDRVRLRNTAVVCIATKPADETLLELQLPIVDTWDGVRRNRQCVFWPQTKLIGTPKKDYHRRKITDLLHRLWVPKAHVIVQFDEIGYLESLGQELKDLIDMYWREARSQDITLIAGKQRPQGAGRGMHSETWWTLAFPPKDEDDAERFAQLLGPRRYWMDVLRQLDRTRREFVIKHSRTGTSYITWVDTPLRAIPRQRARTPSLYHASQTNEGA